MTDNTALVERLRSARSNGDPKKYMALITVAEAHEIADALTAAQEEIERLTRERDAFRIGGDDDETKPRYTTKRLRQEIESQTNTLKLRATTAEATATRLQGEVDALKADKLRLDTLHYESWDLRCHNIPTGGDDYDIGWKVIGHWMAEPQERTVGETFSDDPRAAIDDAIANRTLTKDSTNG